MLTRFADDCLCGVVHIAVHGKTCERQRTARKRARPGQLWLDAPTAAQTAATVRPPSKSALSRRPHTHFALQMKCSLSRGSACTKDVSFGCAPGGWLWVRDGCAGHFQCGGHPIVSCVHRAGLVMLGSSALWGLHDDRVWCACAAHAAPALMARRDPHRCELGSLFDIFGSDKSKHGYDSAYCPLLLPLRNSTRTVVELGFHKT